MVQSCQCRSQFQVSLTQKIFDRISKIAPDNLNQAIFSPGQTIYYQDHAPLGLLFLMKGEVRLQKKVHPKRSQRIVQGPALLGLSHFQDVLWSLSMVSER